MGGKRGRLIGASDRRKAVELIEEAVSSGATQAKACREVGITERTFQRWCKEGHVKEDQRPHAPRKT
ncbi:helix-turn-helix domain-containing protein, partial [Dethiosulfovibrio russensis]|uniref:helix-turn-helix domain-containing protein n=1 Tax=Dethiosulfovibrio russensis TaxID=133534 RepID=UPI0034DD7E76